MLDWAEKACQGQMLYHICPLEKAGVFVLYTFLKAGLMFSCKARSKPLEWSTTRCSTWVGSWQMLAQPGNALASFAPVPEKKKVL